MRFYGEATAQILIAVAPWAWMSDDPTGSVISEVMRLFLSGMEWPSAAQRVRLHRGLDPA
jgi:hypothetical protein